MRCRQESPQVFARHAPAATTAVRLQRAVCTQVATGFCNETVYGKMNLLEVTGLVRMGAAEADAGRRMGAADAVDDAEGSEADGSEAGVAAPRRVPFDAWPAASALNDKYHAECATHAAAPEEDKGWELPATTRWEERCGFGVFDREELQPEHAARAAATRAAATDDAAEHVPEQSSN